MLDYINKINTCALWTPEKFLPFTIGGQQIGHIRRDLGDVIPLADDGYHLPALPYAELSARLDELTLKLCARNQQPLRREKYPLVQAYGDQPLAEIDRVAVPWFGVKGFGVHVNGYVRKDDGLYMWVAQRAKDRQVDPGKLDNVIGGGLPVGLSIQDNLVKEAWEEAGITKDLALTAQPIHAISYKREMMGGLRNDTLFIYDLEFPPDIIPRNTDGEVESFQLMPIAEVAAIIGSSDRFKFNCNLVIIDFLLRHHYFAPDVHAELHQAMVPLRSAFPL
jgi:8-oxo-dGTP pyrophosphatase MutT (NUDIX family)